LIIEPAPALLDGAPIRVRTASVALGRSSAVRRGTPSIALSGTALVLAFGAKAASGLGPSGVLFTRSTDGGATWDEPIPIVADSRLATFPAALSRISDTHLRLSVIRLGVDLRLGGNEPFTTLETIELDSFDGGWTWTSPGRPIRLMPGWTEMYGPSNPHVLGDGDLLWAFAGTIGRDEGWTVATVRTGLAGEAYRDLVHVASGPRQAFADPDIARLRNGSLLAVFREMYTGRAHQSRSADNGRTWSTPQPTGFRGSNVHLFPLNDGSILSLHRDEDPARPGVSVERTIDGASWEWLGQMYAAANRDSHLPTRMCGYPAVARTGSREFVCVLQTYCAADGARYLHVVQLEDET